jgi:RHH-type transcriptional regulator, proline utilization regulon repressor / proline dehydrogenase / delta 1-pyrroline-5-carboxylate dehydrogenase
VMSPIIESARDKLLSALTTLQDGETWLLEPKSLDSSGRLWSPGIRAGVKPGSEFHRTEYFGPVLGIMHASDLDEAIRWQNATDFGLTAGIHSLDPGEVNTWIDRVEAGNLYVNRSITGAVVQRQPFGGWKRSTVGTTSKAGGPNYLTHLGSWHPRPLRSVPPEVQLSDRVEAILSAVEGSLGAAEIDGLRAAAASDQVAWSKEFGIKKDVTGLGVERNVFRYLPVPVTVRGEGSLSNLVRVVLAAARAGAPIMVSTDVPLPDGVAEHEVETHEGWLDRVREEHPERIRVTGSPGYDVSRAVGGDPDVAIYGGAVTQSGRIELLPFLREQAISITNHRFGNPDAAFEAVLPRS